MKSIKMCVAKKYEVGTEFTQTDEANGLERTRYFKVTGYDRKGQMRVVNYGVSYFYEEGGIPVFSYDDCNETYLLNPWIGGCWTCFPEVLLKPENIVHDTID